MTCTNTFLLVKYKEEGKNLLYTANTLIAWFYLINLFIFFIEMLISWYGQNTYELYYFSELKYFNDRNLAFIYNMIKTLINSKITIFNARPAAPKLYPIAPLLVNK